MNNWINVLKEAHYSMKNIQAMSVEPDPQQLLHAQLFGNLYRISTNYNEMKILFNIQMTTIGLSSILHSCRLTSSLICAF